MASNKVVIIYNATHHVLLFKKELIQTLKKNDFEVIALASKDSYVEKLKSIVDDYYEIKLDSAGINPFKDTYLIFQLYFLLKQIKPCVVLNFTIKPVVYGTLAANLNKNISVINTITGLGTAFLSQGIANKVAKFLYKHTFNYSHLIFFQNPDDKEFFRINNIIKNDNTLLIPGSGVDLEKFKPVKKRKSEKIKILFIGRIIGDKGVYELIEAASIVKKKFPDITFILMGMLGVKNRTSIEKYKVENWVKSGLIEYIPFKNDVRDYISDSDLIVLPSYREGTPKTLLEAASMGKPIIATDVPGCREVVINEKNGFLCEVKNSNSLAEQIIRFVELDYSSKLKMGFESRKLAEQKFDIKIVNDVYVKSLKNLINAK